MKMYNKPEIYVTEFTPNEAYTVTCTGIETPTSYVTVDCVKTTSENIFIENMNGCNLTTSTNNVYVYEDFDCSAHKYSYQEGKNGQIVEYYCNVEGDIHDGDYLIWAGSMGSGENEDYTTPKQNHGDHVLNKLIELAGLSWQGLGKNMVWHAGLIKADMRIVKNQS